MKKIIYKSLACICLLSLAFSCTTDNDADMQEDRSVTFNEKSGGTVWDKALAQDNGDGTVTFLVDEREIKAELEALLAEQQTPLKIVSLTIEEKFATNNPTAKGYMLIGGTGASSGISIGMPVVSRGGTFFSPGPVNGGPRKAVSCRGCGSGCFLEYYDIDGHFVPYCDSAGCGPYCDKMESSMF